MRCDCVRDEYGLVVDECPRCEAAISNAEDARSGVDFDPSGRMGDLAADRYEDWLMGDDR